MNIIDRFITGIGYGATAYGAVMFFAGMLLLLIGIIGAIIHAVGKDDDE